MGDREVAQGDSKYQSLRGASGLAEGDRGQHRMVRPETQETSLRQCRERIKF